VLTRAAGLLWGGWVGSFGAITFAERRALAAGRKFVRPHLLLLTSGRRKFGADFRAGFLTGCLIMTTITRARPPPA
jgi:hypothetical protein